MGKRLSTHYIEREVIDFLKHTPSSIKGIEDGLGHNYYTIRPIVNDLLERGIITVAGYQDRHRIFSYVVGSDGLPQDRIPRITDLLVKKSSKITDILAAVGNEDDMMSVLAAKNLPRHVVQLLIAANFASHGQDVGFRLERVREQMQKDFLYLKNAAHLYEQILKEPRFWDNKFLSEMTQDPDYNYVVIQRASDHYERDN